MPKKVKINKEGGFYATISGQPDMMYEFAVLKLGNLGINEQDAHLLLGSVFGRHMGDKVNELMEAEGLPFKKAFVQVFKNDDGLKAKIKELQEETGK